MSPPETEVAKRRRAIRPVERDATTYNPDDLRNSLIAEGRRQVNEVGPHELSYTSWSPVLSSLALNTGDRDV